MNLAGLPFRAVQPRIIPSIRRGVLGRCPRCGEGRLFARYLKTAETCDACGLGFHHHRADDFPPYVVMFIVGHLVGYGIYASESRVEEIPMWVHIAIWPALSLALCLLLLQPVKGGVVGLQYALGMHGFGGARRTHVDSGTPTEENALEHDAGRRPEG